MAGPIPAPPQGFTLDTPQPLVPDITPPPTGYIPDPAHPGAVKPQPGGPKDPNAPENSLTPGALDDATSRLILTGQMDPMGMSGGPVRLQILNNRDVMLKKYGITDQQLPSIRSQFDADSKAYSQRTQQSSFQQQAYNAAQQHFNQISTDLDNLPAQSSGFMSVPLNVASNTVQRLSSGHTITDLDAQIPLFQAEIAKIMTANPSTGAGNLTDAARQEFDVLNSSRDPQARKEAMQKILQMAQEKISGDDQEMSRLGKKIGGGLASYANLGTAAPGAPGTPPPTAPGSTTPPSPIDPTLKNVGGFNDELTFSPQGAQQFHDALYSALASKQLKTPADVAKWQQSYNQQHGTDFGVDLNDAGTKQAIAAAASGKQFGVGIPQMTQTEAARLQDRLKTNATDNPKVASTVAGAADTATVGADKQISAVADAANDALNGKGFDYTGNLNADTSYLNDLRAQHPGYFLGGQLAGGLAIPSFGARTVPQFARLGAGYGGIYGFNENPTQPLVNRGVNAATGAITGTVIPYGLSLGGKGLAALGTVPNVIRGYLPKTAQTITDVDPQAVAAAGQAEGVNVNRAMVDPSVSNKVSAVDRSMVGGPILQRGMNTVKGQIADKTAALGGNGTPLEPVDAGNAVSQAANDYIKSTGADFRNQYGALKTATQGTKFATPQANLQVESLIHDLSETPNMNANELSFLQGIHQDLSKGLSVDAIRALRSKINGDLASGNLTFGPDEARVKSIADAAATDLENGLEAAGKGDIAARFKQVDGAYRDRMQFINGTIQDLIGKRGSNLSGEQVYSNLRSLAGPRGDSDGLTQFLGQMAPDERQNIQATLANALGKDRKGNFSTAILANNAATMPQAMKVAVFGKQGAESLNNLATLANAHNSVASKMSGSPTGVANDYRSWLNTVLFGGAGEILTHSPGKAAAVALGATAIKGGRDILNARLLLNKDISNWLKNVPAGSVQKALDVHLARLNSIAARNPGLASDIAGLKTAIRSAANTNTPMTGAAAASPDSGPDQKQ